MQYLKNPNTNFFDKYGVLKYSNYLPERDLPIIENIQNDNLFIKKKLNDLEKRLDRHSARNHYYSDRKDGKASRISAVLDTKQPISLSLIPVLERPKAAGEKRKERSKTAKTRISYDGNESVFSRKSDQDEIEEIRELKDNSNYSNFKSKSVLRHTPRVDSAASTEHLDNILDNLKSHRRSANRRSVFEEKVKSESRIKSAVSNASFLSTDFNPQIINNDNVNKAKSSNNINNNTMNINNNSRSNNNPTRNSHKHVSKEQRRKSRHARAKTAATKKNKEQEDKEYEHRFYSSSWRIHSEFAPMPKEGNMDPTHPMFYCVGKKIPETFIFHPDWV